MIAAAFPDNGVLILDGGTGSELRRRGLPLSTECWSAVANIGHRELLTAIHRDYIAAGADIVTANTFGASRFVLDPAGLGDRTLELSRAAVEAARHAARAADRRVLVAASISSMPPGFDSRAYPEPAVEAAAYRELAGCFADAGVDLILLEMMQQPERAARAAEAARGSGLPFWVGVSARLGARAGARAGAGLGAQTGAAAAGTLVTFDDPAQDLEPVIEAIVPFAPAGIAVMHTPIEAMEPALALVRRHWQGPLGAWAEIPYDEDPDRQPGPAVPPADYAAAAARWLTCGVTLVGGCCGTSPAHIRELARSLGR